jgi:hypothetical protein
MPNINMPMSQSPALQMPETTKGARQSTNLSKNVYPLFVHLCESVTHSVTFANNLLKN